MQRNESKRNARPFRGLTGSSRTMNPGSSRRAHALSAIALLPLLPTGATLAVEVGDRVDLHGYGYQDYAQASANTYLGADRHGSWDNNFVGLVMAATLTEKSKFWAQIEDTASEGVTVTWAFVDYELSDDVRLHAGRVKMPLGFYNEIIDAKPLQPMALEPSLYQGAADIVHDSYQGVGIDVEQDIAGGHVQWQVYGGNVYDRFPAIDTRDRRAFGGRVTYRTPIEGVTLMGSACRTQVQTLATGTMSNEDASLGLKLENHFNSGYALPVAEGSVAAGSGRKSWNLALVSADFQF